ncbi:MAG TPA: hypothetical protein VFO76_09440 [Candidatus Kapabacteria bacterium]|nr:hypothetical protein [Candidatus Kapabacteria bacterium]
MIVAFQTNAGVEKLEGSVLNNLTDMKKTTIISYLCTLTVMILLASNALAQGGIGKLPRDDVVMLSQAVRDSLSDEMFARLEDLRRYALANNLDSAAPLIAFNTGSGPAGWSWSRACSMSNPDDVKRVQEVVDKIKKLFTDYSDPMHQEYFAVFKTKDTPSGQMAHYQINLMKGAKKKMVSFHYYPVGDKLLFGTAN